MDVRSIQDLKRFVDEVGKKLAEQDKFFTVKLATRLGKAAQEHSDDPTIVQMASFLNSRSNNGGHLISRAELKDVYNRLWTHNTKCASFLTEELGVNPNNLVSSKKMTRSENEGAPLEDLYSKFADRKLVSELQSAFDKKADYRPYDPVLAKKAERLCKDALPGNPSIETVGGESFAILCRASYDTPKGKTDIIVPVEVASDKVLYPTVFLGVDGFYSISKENVEEQIVVTAGKKFSINKDHVLAAIKKVKFASTADDVDDVDRAVMRLKLKTASVTSTHDGILYQQVDSYEDVKIPESSEVQTFAAELSSTAGSAAFVYGKENVKLSHDMVKAKLSNCGFKDATIKLSSVGNDTLTYSVSLGRAGFKVPVKIANKKAVEPMIIIASGQIEEFNHEGIVSALDANDQASNSSALGFDIKSPQELISIVEAACENKDFKTASSAIASLELTGDEIALKHAVSLFTGYLSGSIEKKAKPQMKTIKIGGNIVEATTGLPVDRVYVDDNGVVQAKYRQNIDVTENNVAAGFMHSKILLGL
jgi:hypothetical protein